jgi:hypothetical protein
LGGHHRGQAEPPEEQRVVGSRGEGGAWGVRRTLSSRRCPNCTPHRTRPARCTTRLRRRISR